MSERSGASTDKIAWTGKTRTGCVSNSKGGVGKTLTSDAIASLAGEQEDVPTLIVDLDGQCNATEHHIGTKNPTEEDKARFKSLKTIYDVLIDPVGTDLAKAIVPSRFPNVWIMPGDDRIVNVPTALSGRVGWDGLLDKQLKRVYKNFGLIVIDTGPAVSGLTSLALRASHDFLIIPTDNSHDGFRGVDKILAVLQDLKDDRNHEIDLVKVILTAQQKGGSKAVMKSKKEVIEKFGAKYLEIDLPHTTKILDAQWADGAFAPPLSLLDKDHKLYKGYQRLTKIALGREI